MRGWPAIQAGGVLVLFGMVLLSYVDDTSILQTGMAGDAIVVPVDKISQLPPFRGNRFGITGNETWDDLSDSGTLLRYLAHQQFIKLDNNPGMSHNQTGTVPNATEGELDDDLFYPLDCDFYDDDSQYPNALCTDGDNQTCHKSVYTHAVYNESCHAACSAGWGVPCGWEAVRHMRRVCNGTFTATFPGSSKNNNPSGVKMENAFIASMEEHFWACNVHAFCSVCVNDEKIVDDYCKAAVIRYNSLYAVVGTMNNMESYWCDDRILTHIENGTYCGNDAGKMKWCMDEGEIA